MKDILNIFFNLWLLNVNSEEFLVKDELSQGWVTVHHLLEGAGLAGEVSLSLVLLLEELSGQVINELETKLP